MAEGPEHVFNANRRGGYYPRGRGRARPVGVLDKLGVHDLREHLDRKRENRGADHDGNAPPPDPKYNYLQDPEREKHHEHPQPHHSRPNRRPNNNRNEFVVHQNQHQQQQQQTPIRNRPQFHHQSGGSSGKDIENPINIKIEFSPSTGKHTYELDEEKVLPTIKHVPDKKPLTYNRSFRGGTRGGNYRGRGRGGYRKNYAKKPNEEDQFEDAKVDEENNLHEGEAAPETHSDPPETEDKTEEAEKIALPPIEQNQNEVSSNQLNDNNADDEQKISVSETAQEKTEKEE